uniref:MCP methyltransferase CheR-type SAM-binding domain-containing protein n=1 Tax=Chromera velia CCMP2878 TaxID=1169474 RepID=A0A0G4HMN2_9ALVE|mmetsp:Transcript_46355/g.91411  ORF Transcript_46355/g.91411 Transcript_46355/m.91411 type:complete len:388 (+) Transcript_46355:81-1244(+)|eukprot:Cvel_29203.t1-p1 / transcript=Cvel_29203.t1 / gene=Cvel_29203 / organism=Chromera_velia_CCMP2878 / gene_product=hypothetical protein / transcript_product=hypothetical protein / location=Cvel_scaffold3953:634-1951(-) / protein_length=387 / sequence_SO=supercontig / SO=protein_coding / is_pseudo=false
MRRLLSGLHAFVFFLEATRLHGEKGGDPLGGRSTFSPPFGSCGVSRDDDTLPSAIPEGNSAIDVPPDPIPLTEKGDRTPVCESKGEGKTSGGQVPDVYAAEPNQAAFAPSIREPEDRYPFLYQTAAAASKELAATRVPLGAHGSQGKGYEAGGEGEAVRERERVFSILSFGCSSGEEARTLARKYFRDAASLGVDRVQVYGADLSEKRLEMARKSELQSEGVKEPPPDGDSSNDPTTWRNNSSPVVYFNNRIVPLSRFGPYDVIMANSVLCMSTGARTYPFALFERTVTALDAVLKEDGVLVMANAQYRLRHSATLSESYETLPGPSPDDCNPGGCLLRNLGIGKGSRSLEKEMKRRYRARFPDGKTEIPHGHRALQECVLRRRKPR